MSFLSYHALAGAPAEKEALRAEYAAAQKFGRVALGTNHLFLSRVLGLGGSYIAYPDIRRWFIRQCEATVEVSTFYSYLFVVDYGDGREKAVNFEEKPKVDALREALRAAHPELTFGPDKTKKPAVNW
ncbi:MAG: hypothetical protein LKJ90_00900 [Faecalibacterium sp.]|jgi:hypothetical protein|nr:hypothetical protein [Faecalibacterium sp.]